MTWGGAEVELRPPPTNEAEVSEGTAVPEAQTPARQPGPLLLAGLRDGHRATLVVVGEINGDSIAPFPNPRYPEDAERLSDVVAIGTEWILFAEGVRVGRLVADQVISAIEYCTPRASVSGVVEVVPGASEAERFLALAASDAAEREYDAYAASARDYDQGVATLTIAQEIIPRVGAVWPVEGVLAARQDIQAFGVAGMTGRAVAATFLSRDQLAIAPPGQGAYAVFVLGVPTAAGYREGFSWYRAVDTEGKGVPRYFSHLDWDGDGDGEILLDVFGSNRRWYAGLSQRQGEWVRSFQDACGSGSSSGL
ncbi:MAG: hypothetical protein OEO79_04660 [Gemmatimonadota bacterium]|nr:hypothetical protein [Gemmatimonadota bacterium]